MSAFAFAARSTWRSLKTSRASDAKQGQVIVEQPLCRLKSGQLALRHDVDLADFIVSEESRPGSRSGA